MNYRNNKLWPYKNVNPLNESEVELFATIVFPTLLPDAKGDPTNTAQYNA